MKAALKEMARDEKRRDRLVANYHVRKAYRQRQTGRLPGWMKPIPCLCKVKHYSQGYTSPCGRWVCSDYVRRERYFQLQNSDIMTERKKNEAYWKQMKAKENKQIYAWSRNKLQNFKDAKLEVQMRQFLDKAEADAIWEEAAVYLPRKSHEEE